MIVWQRWWVAKDWRRGVQDKEDKIDERLNGLMHRARHVVVDARFRGRLRLQRVRPLHLVFNHVSFTLVRPLSHSWLSPLDRDECIRTGDSRRDNFKPPPPSEVEVLAIVGAGHSPKYSFKTQQTAIQSIVSNIRSMYHTWPRYLYKIGY